MDKVHLTSPHFLTLLQITSYDMRFMDSIHVTAMQKWLDALHLCTLMIKKLLMQLMHYALTIKQVKISPLGTFIFLQYYQKDYPYYGIGSLSSFLTIPELCFSAVEVILKRESIQPHIMVYH